MNTDHSSTKTTKDIRYSDLMWQSANAQSRYRNETEEAAPTQRDKSSESILCVLSFIAIMVLACIL